MRTIKFRGQRLDNNEWVYGCIGYGFNQSIQYIMPKMYFATRDFGEVDENDNMIIEDEIAIGGFIPVNPETVGQFTGLQDKNGVDVYEGDKIKYYSYKRYTQCSHPECGNEIDELYIIPITDEIVFHKSALTLKSSVSDDPFLFPLDYVGLANIEEIKDDIFGEDRNVIYSDEEMQCDCNGNEINESITGFEVIGNIFEK